MELSSILYLFAQELNIIELPMSFFELNHQTPDNEAEVKLFQEQMSELIPIEFKDHLARIRKKLREKYLPDNPKEQ